MPLKKAPEPKGYELYGPEPTLPDFPHSEWAARLDKVQRLMREGAIDLLMLWSEPNVRYFTGFTSMHWRLPSMQPLVALIPAVGAPLVIAPQLFRWTVEAQSWVRDIRCQGGDIDEHDEQVVRDLPREVAATVREMGHGKACIALEKGPEGGMYIPRPLNDIQMLMEELPEARFVDGARVIWRCRQIKSPLEIERLTKAADIHAQAVSDVVEQYRPGMTEVDVGKIFICSAYQNGAETVLTGSIRCGSQKEGVFDVKHAFDGLAIDRGYQLGLDLGVCYKGYWADICRVLSVGPMTEKFREYSEQLIRAFDAMTGAVKPGMTVGELHRIVYEAGGVDAPGEMLGHGIGLDMHEPPVIMAHSDVVLEPGMTFSVEPMIFRGLRCQGGEGIFHIEDMIVITEAGFVPVHGFSRDVLQVAHPFQ